MQGIVNQFRILFVIFFFPFLSLGQNELNVIETFTTNNYLPSNDIRWITQDHSGFLWMGTWDGLVKYDGTEFKVYRHDPNIPTSLGYFEVSMVCVDKYNYVWTHSGGKISRYEPLHYHFKTYDKSYFPETSSLPGSPSPYFHLMMTDNEGNLYVKYLNRLFTYDALNDSFDRIYFNDEQKIDFTKINNAVFDKDGYLWLFQILAGWKFGLIFCLEQTSRNTFSIIKSFVLDQKFLTDFPPNSTIHLKIWKSVQDKIWLATNYGLYLVEGDTVRIFNNQIPSGEFAGQDLVIWSNASQGLMAFYPKDDRLFTLAKQSGNSIVSAYFADNQQNIWLCRSNKESAKNGLELTFRTGDYFKQYLKEKDNNIPSAVFGLAEDKNGNIWAGGRPNDHLVKINPEGQILSIPINIKP